MTDIVETFRWSLFPFSDTYCQKLVIHPIHVTLLRDTDFKIPRISE